MIAKILRLFRGSRVNISPPKLTTAGKVSILLNKLQTLNAQLYLERVSAQYLHNKLLTGKPEYTKAYEMADAKIREEERMRDWFEEKLEDQVDKLNEEEA